MNTLKAIVDERQEHRSRLSRYSYTASSLKIIYTFYEPRLLILSGCSASGQIKLLSTTKMGVSRVEHNCRGIVPLCHLSGQSTTHSDPEYD